MPSVDSPQVSHGFEIARGPFAIDRVDGEVLIVNLQSGVYYNLRHFGADLWEGLEKAQPTESLVATLAERHGVPVKVAEGILAELVADLVREGIVVDAAGELDRLAKPTGDAAERGAVQGALLERFTDMKELLMLDPVHEVDEAGWPVKIAT